MAGSGWKRNGSFSFFGMLKRTFAPKFCTSANAEVRMRRYERIHSKAVFLDRRLHQRDRPLQTGGWNGCDEDVDNHGVLFRYKATITLTFECTA